MHRSTIPMFAIILAFQHLFLCLIYFLYDFSSSSFSLPSFLLSHFLSFFLSPYITLLRIKNSAMMLLLMMMMMMMMMMMLMMLVMICSNISNNFIALKHLMGEFVL